MRRFLSVVRHLRDTRDRDDDHAKRGGEPRDARHDAVQRGLRHDDEVARAHYRLEAPHRQLVRQSGPPPLLLARRFVPRTISLAVLPEEVERADKGAVVTAGEHENAAVPL